MRASFAAVFPGQGSQSVGMLKDWAESQPIISQTFEEASSILGYDLWRIVREGPEAELNRTEITQPAMLAAGVATWRVWQAFGGPIPLCMAGHSLGEYTALVCANSLTFTDAVRLVAERGRLMQTAVPQGQGAMAAVLGLEDEVVRAACDEASQGVEVIEAVNFNSPGQVVIAGHTAALARATTLLLARGAKRVVPLAVSVPSHSSLMREAAESLGKVLEGITLRTPMIPVLHNVDAAEHPAEADLRSALKRQLHSPVLWVDTVHAMQARGAKACVEFGPGKVLAGLIKRIARDFVAYPVLDAASCEAAIHAMKEFA